MATTNWTHFADGDFFKATVDGMASGDSGLSSVVNLAGYLLVAIHMPSTWTSAALTALISPDGSTFNSFYTYDGEWSYSSSNAIASVVLGVKPEHAMQMQGAVKFRSGNKAAAVNQDASRTLTLIALKL